LQLNNQKFSGWGGGTAHSLDPTPVGAIGASILTPSALNLGPPNLKKQIPLINIGELSMVTIIDSGNTTSFG